MLQLRNICKKYVTGDLTQVALDDVSLNLRDSEFVAVLGPSGSGKTTLLNVIGGLDRYDTGDLIINGVSTKKYRDRDWDSYRNHTVGFVFQGYNLIAHQSILANVELALTISGIPRAERRRRAQQALQQVGLGEQCHKRPNQLSGGQMQRVAIARALVNNPDILLADEPTGALDSETSVQVMDLLKAVAKDRLVVMVTHNAELAERYASRTVRLADGRVTGDTDPYTVDEAALAPPRHENMGHASMSFFTALLLSFNNLRTKKARTLLTSFAGSIGIIGIALILALSNGVSSYITDIQKSTMLSYPITIEAQTIDLSSILSTGRQTAENKLTVDHPLDAVYSNGAEFEMASAMTASVTENNLTAFKKYLDDPASEIRRYVGETGILYTYDTEFDVYARDPDGELVNTDGSTLTEKSSSGMVTGMTRFTSGLETFQQLLPSADGGISPAVTDSYEVLYGRWPQSAEEIVLIVGANNEIAASALYKLGVLPAAEYKDLMQRISDGEKVSLDSVRLDYDALCDRSFWLLCACDRYEKQGDGLFADVAENADELETLLEEKGIQLRVTGIVRVAEDAAYTGLDGAVGYTRALTDAVIARTDASEVVTAQRDEPTVNVLSGLTFAPADDAAKIDDVITWIGSQGITEKAALCRTMMRSVYGADSQQYLAVQNSGEAELAGMLDTYLLDPDEETLLSIYDNYISAGSYENNMAAFGVVSPDAPASVSIYADSFEDKDAITACISDYNRTAGEADQITYTDYVGLLMSSVTTIINVISYVLIAFVAVSLVVSSIMIGIITFISVLERTKEIGILRAIGASKRNIAQVFNAETFIVGLCAGLIGVGLSLLLLIPGNLLIHSLAGTTDVNASLPPAAAAILVLLSMLLTLIAGIIPSRKAAKKDPVAALRTE